MRLLRQPARLLPLSLIVATLLTLSFAACSAAESEGAGRYVAVAEPIELRLSATYPGHVTELPKLGMIVSSRHGGKASAVARLQSSALEARVLAARQSLSGLQRALIWAGYYFDDFDGDVFRHSRISEPRDEPPVALAKQLVSDGLLLDKFAEFSGQLDTWGDLRPDQSVIDKLKGDRTIRRALDSLTGNGALALSEIDAVRLMARIWFRQVRLNAGLEDVRIAPDARGVAQFQPNNTSLLHGRKIAISIPSDGSASQCVQMVRYWEDVERLKLWTKRDVQFAAQLASNSSPWDQVRPIAIGADHAIEKDVFPIAEQLKDDCERLNTEIEKRSIFRRIVNRAIGGVRPESPNLDNPAGLPVPSQLLTKLDIGFNVDGMLLWARELSNNVDLRRLDVLTKDDLVGINEMIVENYRVLFGEFIILNGRAPQTAWEIQDLFRSLLVYTNSKLPLLQFEGKYVAAMEENPGLLVEQVLSGLRQASGSALDDATSIYARAFENVDIQTRSAIERSTVSIRSKRDDIEAARLARIMISQAETEKDRIAADLLSRWRQANSALKEALKDFDAGDLWAPEPMEITSLLVEEGQRVESGQALVEGRALFRFNLAIALEREVAGNLPFPVGSSIELTINDAGLFPLTYAQRAKLLAEPDPQLTLHALRSIHAKATAKLKLLGRVVGNDNSSKLSVEVATPLEARWISATKLEPSETDLLKRFGLQMASSDKGDGFEYPAGLFYPNERIEVLSLRLPDHDTATYVATERAWKALLESRGLTRR
jgi:hypothetical protein